MCGKIDSKCIYQPGPQQEGDGNHPRFFNRRLFLMEGLFTEERTGLRRLVRGVKASRGYSGGKPLSTLGVKRNGGPGRPGVGQKELVLWGGRCNL